MSMTKYMHPRNIYKSPPDFKQLAIDYPEFREHVTQELSGKVSLDFKNLEALRSLTCTLLKKDFSLDVQIPLNKLIPTIPLRLNYILWIEDLMEISKPMQEMTDIRGIDIGTGASCVYPLLAASKNKWHMLATDINDESIDIAKDNVSRNHLDDLIHVYQASKDTFFGEYITCQHDFTMCNPPFFATHQETIFEFKSRKQSRPRPKNAFCATQQEVIANGGEVDFISRMIQESKECPTKIRIFTTMIGHASSLAPLKKLLRDVDVVSFKQTEFCQGNTTRWGLAWTFLDIDLRKVPETTLAVNRKQKKEKTFQYQINNVPEDLTLHDVHIKLQEMFADLKFTFRFKQTKLTYSYDIEASENTWQHQRRKRRAAQRSGNNSHDSTDSKSPTMDDSGVECVVSQDLRSGIDQTTELIQEMRMKSPRKRELEDDGYYDSKRFKSDYVECHQRNTDLLLSARITVFRNGSDINIELNWNDGHGNRDILHQVLQYIKNNLKL